MDLFELDKPGEKTSYQFDTVDQIKAAFLQKKFSKIPNEINVNGVNYHRASFSPYPFEQYLKGYTAMAIFATQTTKAAYGQTVAPAPEVEQAQKQKADAMEQGGLEQLIIFGWNFVPGLVMLPLDVVTTTQARKGDFESSRYKPNVLEQQGQDNVIGNSVVIRIANLPGSKPIKAKVDTGASMCSLHADNWEINRASKTVKFINKHISPNIITLPIVDQQPISSADGGTEYRPVVELNIVINDTPHKKVQFNLNDRSGMQDQVLIGQNVLKQGKYLINPQQESAQDGYDWDELNKLFENARNRQPSRTDKIRNVYEAMLDSDVTLEEIMRYIKTDAITTLESIKY